MMQKSRALLLLLALWFPLQGMAATLLYCNSNATETATVGHASLHQDHPSLSAIEADEKSEVDDCGASHHSAVKHDSPNPEICDHCQQCCQISATLIPSSAPSDNYPLATLETGPSESADSIIPEPLFHPPQHLS